MSRTRAAALTAGGIAAVVTGTLSPWATFPGFPGKMTLSGHPGGARLFCLVLVAFAVPAVLGKGQRAALTAGGGIIVIAGYNAIAIASEGAGLGDVAWGAWLTVIGGGALLLASGRRPYASEGWALRLTRPIPRSIEGAVVVGVVGGILWLVVWGLDIDESSRFTSFVIFIGVAAAALSQLGVTQSLQRLFRLHRSTAVAAAAAAALAFPFTQGGDAYWVRVFASIGVFAVAAIGLNVVVGLAGLLDLGYVAFFGVGAYVGALFANAGLTTTHIHLPFPVVIFLGAGIAALFGVVIGAPTLRLRGDYLAIVTLGFGEIFRITANNWDGLTRGPNGISGIPDLKVAGFDFGGSHRLLGIDLPGFANYYFVELAVLVLAIVAFTRLNDSRIGRAWVAIREDEVAAAVAGVDTIRLKLLAFAIGAFLAGAAGTVNAHLTTQVSPDSYTFLESILLVAAVVLGGMGTVPGALVGSAALFVIPEKLRSFQDKRLLLFGAALVLMMRFRPEGIIPSRRRQREFHEVEGGADATGAPPGSPVA